VEGMGGVGGMWACSGVGSQSQCALRDVGGGCGEGGGATGLKCPCRAVGAVRSVEGGGGGGWASSLSEMWGGGEGRVSRVSGRQCNSGLGGNRVRQTLLLRSPIGTAFKVYLPQ